MSRIYTGVALASAAMLAAQVVLTRVFSVVQWHHFAFMAVGLGLLGYGASGTLITVVPTLRATPLRTAAWSATLIAPATGLALLAVVMVPFDAYLISLDLMQWAFLIVQVAAMVLPFLCGGLVVGSLLAGFPQASGELYAASFLGAGAGAVMAVPMLEAAGESGALIAAGAMGATGAVLLWWAAGGRVRASPAIAAACVVAVGAAMVLHPPELPLSPYKSLSQLRRFPDASLMFSWSNATSRVDVVRSAAVRSAPGLSITYPDVPPSLPGLTVDGDSVRGLPVHTDASFTGYLPTAAAYRVRRGRALILGIGVEVLGAVQHGMAQTVVLERNPLVAEATRRSGGIAGAGAAGAASDRRAEPRLHVVVENPRTYLRRSGALFDVIQIPPQESFQVVASGAFSLTEEYAYTTEAFRDALRRLAPGGVLAVTRWVQTPPSEELRAWATVVSAIEQLGDEARNVRSPLDPAVCLIALRSLNTITILARLDGFTPQDVEAVRTFAESRRFDLPYAPGLSALESNRYNVMPVDLHHQAFVAMLDPGRRTDFLRRYEFDVRPTGDDRPFFFHFFRWHQVPQIVTHLGRTWQPFGGGGYLVLLALLAITGALSTILIVAPLRTLRRTGRRPTGGTVRRGPVFVFFVALGFAYLFVEIPLVQQVILLLGSPTYAVAAVLCTLLVASGTGSLLSARLQDAWRGLLPVLVTAIIGTAILLPWVLTASLGSSEVGRLTVVAAVVVPLGVLMGVPFPSGVRRLGQLDPSLVPWAWAMNGCASVLGSFLAVIIALEWGFRVVLALGGFAYAVAWMALMSLITAARAEQT